MPKLQSLALVTLLGAAMYVSTSPAFAAEDGESVDDARQLPPMADHHRPIRGNPPLPEGAPGRDTAAVTATPEAGGFSVVPRRPSLTWLPCDQCHEVIPANTEKRKLFTPHYSEVAHGAEQFWCHDCHTPDNEERLHTLKGDAVDFDSAYQICGQCHYQPRRDWYYGAHGKRVADWQGERQVYSCTHCHNPHDPAVRPRAPQRPPPVRRGLEPLHHTAHEAPETADAPQETSTP